jgi:hypothetical protein
MSDLSGFRSLADGLVSLEDYPIEMVEDAVTDLEDVLRGHVSGGAARPPVSAYRDGSLNAERLEREHLRFRESFRELRFLLTVVRNDNHGGNRQALGQYWRILLEALELHLAEESAPPPPPAPGDPD